MSWNDAQVIACKYYLTEIQLFVNKFLMDKCSFMGHWDPCFGLVAVLGTKVRMNPVTCVFCTIVLLHWSFVLNGAELLLNSTNLGNLINHWSMNWAQFKDPVSHMCLAGAVVASWSLTQEWQVRALLLNWKIFLSLNSLNSVKHLEKTPILVDPLDPFFFISMQFWGTFGLIISWHPPSRKSLISHCISKFIFFKASLPRYEIWLQPCLYLQ